jgi:hypothetical protein
MPLLVTLAMPIALWRQIFPEQTRPINPEDFTEAIEDYCLHQAMLEAAETPLLAHHSKTDTDSDKIWGHVRSIATPTP